MSEANMARRGRCLRPLAAAAVKYHEAGSSFRNTVSRVSQLAEPLRFQRDPLHIMLYSTLGVASIVGYEYFSAALRAKGVNVPNGLELLSMTPVACVTGGDKGYTGPVN